MPDHLKRVALGDAPDLADADAAAPDWAPHGDALKTATAERLARLRALQATLQADGRRALLVVLQGRDASGKDGTIRKVFSSCNPLGLAVVSFKAPSDEERAHDFLWRVHAVTPAHGIIGVFNRSHYEDVLVARVRGLAPEAVWRRRYAHINAFEQLLADEGTAVVKLLLHVSRDEQRRRMLDRVNDAEKNWKFREGDLDDRALWPQYTDAYRDVLSRCSTAWAPWYVVPADDKKVRDWLVADTLVRTLESLDLSIPSASPEAVARWRRRIDQESDPRS